MMIFLDSVNINEILEINDLGFLSGITTNPSLLSSFGYNIKSHIQELTKIVQCEISVQVLSSDATSMIKEGHELAEISQNVVIKLPLTLDGIKACNYFSKHGIKTNMTLCFSYNQAFLSAILQATYVSIFVGRLEDLGQNWSLMLKTIRSVFNNNQIVTKILAASIRDNRQFALAFCSGAHIVTAPYKIIKTLINHQLTNIGLSKFISDASNANLKL